MEFHDATSTYKIINASIIRTVLPVNFLQEIDENCKFGEFSDILQVDLDIKEGKISSFSQAIDRNARNHPNLKENVLNLNRRLLFPTFVDIHTHLDKSNTINRSPNSIGTRANALAVALADISNFNAEELSLRVEFSIRAAYHHGTSAIRTHVVSKADLGYTEMVWSVLGSLREKWRGKVDLQFVTFISPPSEFGIGGAAEDIAKVGARYGAVLGTSFTSIISDEVIVSQEDVTLSTLARGSLKDQAAIRCNSFDQELDGLFNLANKLNCDIDVHIDEHGDGLSDSLLKLALKTIDYGYQGRVVAGHCCSLALASPKLYHNTLQALMNARISIISLPMCNMYLQDRVPGHTPLWRGIPPVKELRDAGVPIAFASDNVRDAFYPFGDLDMLEVLSQSYRTAQIDGHDLHPWIDSVTTVPGDIFAQSAVCVDVTQTETQTRTATCSELRHGRLEVGGPANFVITSARSIAELLCRPQYDRIVIRHGKILDTTLPDYSELDVLFPPIPPLPSNSLPPSFSVSVSTSNKNISMYPSQSAAISNSSTNEVLLPEIVLEASLGQLSTQTQKPKLHPIATASVTRELWEAATEIGFFQIINHGISITEIETAFNMSKRFFDLPKDEKERYAFRRDLNAGFEFFQQVRPSTGLPDQKESFQITTANMDSGDLWPVAAGLTEDFRVTLEDFARKSHDVAQRLLSCFAVALDLPADHFEKSHVLTSADSQSTLRLLHYPSVTPQDTGLSDDSQTTRVFRAGAHTDWDCLTLLYQREGENGLEVCPGTHALSGEWTPVEPLEGAITVNIGDMLMRWSDDRLKSTLHRVQYPSVHNKVSCSDRYSIAYFMQADKTAVVQGPLGKYPAITAEEYLQMRIRSNYS
eukprot:gene6724-13621_t